MAIFYLLLFLCTYLVSAARGPVLWNQPKNNQRSSWNDQVNSPSNSWYRNDAPILAQSEIIMPDYIRKQSGFALYPVNQQEQATFGTKLKPQKIRPENYNSQSEKPFGAAGKQQRRSDFPGNKVPPRKWNIGSPYPPVNYYNLKDKQKVHANEVLKVKSLSPQNFRQVFTAEQTPISIKNALNGNSIHKPSVHREYALSAISSPKLNQFSPQNQGYIVSAPSRVSTTSPVDFTTNKSPIFFVTDGYRNVLHQGTNEPEAVNQDTQNKQESKTVEIENAPNTVKIIDHGHTESDRDDLLHEPRDDHDNEKIQTDDRIQNDDDDESDEEEHDATDSKKSQRESSEEESSKSDEEDEREDSREPDNEHADPKHVPTRPIYPGEGVWARQRIRHRPHITQHRFIQPQVEYQTKPDGYEVFSNLEQYFDKQKENIEQNFNRVPKNTPILAQAQIKQPNSVVPLVIYDPFQEFQQLQNRQPIPYIQQPYIQQPYIQRPSHRPVDNNVVQASRSQRYRAHPVQQQPSEEEAEEFVPERLYTQVRNSEDEKHLPQDPVEGPRLKEVIKDSKVHTLYSEEGYEDSAYDHAGHEKKAEQDEGKAKFEKEKVDSKKKKKFIEKPVDNHEGQSVKVIVTESPKPKSDDTSPSDNDYTKNNNKFGANKFNNYITGPEIKTAHIKDKDNGDVQLEIESQVQVIMQPNNSTKAHKYVRIYPKVPAEVSNKDDDQAESHVIEQINEMTLKQFNSDEKAAAADENAPKERRKRASEPWFEDVDIDTEFIDRINHTFEGPRKEVVDTQKFPYYKSKDVNKDSPLRYAENPNNVPVKKAGELSFYKAADKHACPEIIQNIDPVPDHIKNAKESDDYDEEDDEEDDANGESSQVDERVDGDEAVTPKGPRIELGDKIDCLKARYFGENPLDNPFFKEATVGPVEPLFKDLEKAVNSFKSPNKKSASEKKASEIKKDKKDETEKKPLKKSENIKGDFLDNPADHQAAASFIINAEIQPVPNVDNSINSPENDKRVSSALVSLITTPKYTINLVPNNIYDQIKLLEHLPEQAKTEEPREKDNATANEIEPESTTVEPKNENLSTEKIEEIIPTSTEQHSNGNRQSKSLDLDQETKSDDSSEDGETINEPQALRRLRKRPKRPMYQIFDINKFLTTTPFSLIDSDPTTVLPKYKVISEVFYKDEIKPNEQLNVFADVINNIKNSTHTDIIPIESPSRYPEFEILNGGSIEEYDTVPQIKKSSSVRVKKFQSDSSNYNNNVDEEEIAANHEPERNTYQESYVEKRHRQVTKNRKSNTDEEVTTKKTPKYRRRRPTTTTTTLRTTIATQESAPSNHKPYVIDYLEDTEQVIGLVPPESWQYKTIVLGDMEAQNSNDVTERVKMPREKTKPAKSQNPAPVTEPSDEVPPEVNINLFPVIGMKPPSKERARSYFEYLMNNMNTMNKMNSNNSKKIRRRVSSVPRRHLRRTRDASRPSYSEVSRSRGRQTADVEQTTIAPEDDDYVPHRPTNYHYDEKTGKIVYHSKPKEESSEEVEEEIEEIEVPVMPGIYLERAEGATHPTPKQTTVSPLLVTATPPPDGQGLLDFVVLLKNNPNYKYIPDPTTPKPGAVTTTEAFATVDPKSTNPPEFLNILSKVRNDNRYKLIEDPKEAKSKLKTTTPAPPEEEEEEELEEEEGTIENVIVQPSIDLSNVQIFNVGDFLPKIQTPISSDIKTSFVKKYVVDKLFPKLRYMSVFDVVKDYLSQSAPVKYIKSKMNIPDENTGKLNNIDIFDINEFIPSVKPIVTSKPIDYSKYKTIERPRHNLSSRYNAEEQTNLDEVVTVRRPLFEEVQRAEEPRTTKTYDTDEEVPTTQKIVQSRRRSRPRGQKHSSSKSVDDSESPTTLRSSSRRRSKPASTKRPTTLITEASEEIADIYTPTERMTAATNPKAKRVYRKRPIRIRPTTEHVIDDGEHLVRRSVDDDVSDDNLDLNSSHYIIITEDLLEDLFKNGIPPELVDIDKNDEDAELLVSDQSNRQIESNRYVNDNHNQASGYPDRGDGINIAQDLIQEVDGLVSQKEHYTGGKISAKYNANKDKRRRRKKGRRKKNRKGGKKYIDIPDRVNLDDIEIIDENYDRSKKHGGNYRALIDLGPEDIYQYSPEKANKDITRDKYDDRNIDNRPADKISARYNIASIDKSKSNYNRGIKNNNLDKINEAPEEYFKAETENIKIRKDNARFTISSDNSDIYIPETYQKNNRQFTQQAQRNSEEQIGYEQDVDLDDSVNKNHHKIKIMEQKTYKPFSNIQSTKNNYDKNLKHEEEFEPELEVSTGDKSESSRLINKNIDSQPDVEVNNKHYQKHQENFESYEDYTNVKTLQPKNTNKNLVSSNVRDKVIKKDNNKQIIHEPKFKYEDNFANTEQFGSRKSEFDTSPHQDTSNLQITPNNYNKKEKFRDNFKPDDFANSKQPQSENFFGNIKNEQKLPSPPKGQDITNLQIMNKNYDKKQQPRGNFKSEGYLGNTKNTQKHQSSPKRQDVQVMNKKYDKQNFHGGNFESKEYFDNTRNTEQHATSPNKQDTSDVQVMNKTYDKQKHHGANFKSKEHFDDTKNTEKRPPSSTTQDKLDIQVMNKNYDKQQQHGGNFKYDEYFHDRNSQEDSTSPNKIDTPSVQVADNNYNQNQRRRDNFESINQTESKRNQQDFVSLNKQNTSHVNPHRINFDPEECFNNAKGSDSKNTKEDLPSPSDQNTSNEQDKYDDTEFKHSYEDEQSGGNFKSDEDIGHTEQSDQINTQEDSLLHQQNINKSYNEKQGDEESAKSEYLATTTREPESTKKQADLIPQNSQDVSDVQVVNNNYDRSHKHGGNLKSDENIDDAGDSEPNNSQTVPPNNQDHSDVQIINKNYDKKQKHGGNYRSKDYFDNIEQPNRSSKENLLPGSTQDTSDVQIMNKNYDQKHKHGGNLKSEEDIVNDEQNNSQSPNKQNISQVQIMNKNYDQNHKHGGNLKSEEDIVSDVIPEKPEGEIKDLEPQNTQSGLSTPRTIQDITPDTNERSFMSDNDEKTYDLFENINKNDDYLHPVEKYNEPLKFNEHEYTINLEHNKRTSSNVELNTYKPILFETTEYNSNAKPKVQRKKLIKVIKKKKTAENNEKKISDKDIIYNNKHKNRTDGIPFKQDYDKKFFYNIVNENKQTGRTEEVEEPALGKDPMDNKHDKPKKTINAPYTTESEDLQSKNNMENNSPILEMDDNKHEFTTENIKAKESYNIRFPDVTINENEHIEETVRKAQEFTGKDIIDNNSNKHITATGSSPNNNNDNTIFPSVAESEELYHDKSIENQEEELSKKSLFYNDGDQRLVAEDLSDEEKYSSPSHYKAISEDVHKGGTLDNDEHVTERVVNDESETATENSLQQGNYNSDFSYTAENEDTHKGNIMENTEDIIDNNNNHAISTEASPIKENHSIDIPYSTVGEDSYSQKTTQGPEITTTSITFENYNNASPYKIENEDQYGQTFKEIEEQIPEKDVISYNNNISVITESSPSNENYYNNYLYSTVSEDSYGEKTTRSPVITEQSITVKNQIVSTESSSFKESYNIDSPYKFKNEDHYSQKSGESGEQIPEKDVISHNNHIVVTESSANNENYYNDYPYSAVGEDIYTEKTKYESSQEPIRIHIDIANADPDHVIEDRKDDNDVPKLADVALKPEYFFTDPTLPVEVNKLNEDNLEATLDSDDLRRAIEEGDLTKIHETTESDNRRVDEEGNPENNREEKHDLDENSQSSLEEVTVSTTRKNPTIIKDPSKRLYFYAAV